MVNNPSRLGTQIMKYLSAEKCEHCKLRIKDRKSERYCVRCLDKLHRRNSRQASPAKMAKELSALVEDRYLQATIDQIEQPYRDMLTCAGDKDVFMWGSVGVGKTYAMAALIREYLIEGFDCKRINFDDFCRSVRATMNKGAKQTEDELIHDLLEVDKLFIDDLGLRSQQESDFVFLTFYSILNGRQERMLPTLVTSNKNIKQLKKVFDSRIESRLGMAVNINMTGTDRRK